MALVTLESATLTNIGNAIRSKLGKGDLYLPSEMADKILAMSPPKPGFSGWGDEEGTADVAWWAGLKAWIATASEEDLKACVGKTKMMAMSSPFLGTTDHLVRCIGYNCNRDRLDPTRNTLTFQTVDCMAQAIAFRSGTSYNNAWSSSDVKSKLEEYVACTGLADQMCKCTLNTGKTASGSQQNSETYINTVQVFLPSDCEMGFKPGHTGSDEQGYSASYSEFDMYNTEKIPYQYYSTPESRQKNLSGNPRIWWERSPHYNLSNNACEVNANGQPTCFQVTISAGIAPCFVI